MEIKQSHLVIILVTVVGIASLTMFVIIDLQSQLESEQLAKEQKAEELKDEQLSREQTQSQLEAEQLSREQTQSQLEAEQLAKALKEKELEQKQTELLRKQMELELQQCALAQAADATVLPWQERHVRHQCAAAGAAPE